MTLSLFCALITTHDKYITHAPLGTASGVTLRGDRWELKLIFLP